MNIVKVKYYSEKTGEYSSREYTYFAEDPLQVGDIVTVPVKDTTGKAIVAAVNVPESEISTYRDKIKTIPSGSLIDVAPIKGRLELYEDNGEVQGDLIFDNGHKPESLGNFADIFDDPAMPYEDYLEALEEDIEADRNFDKSPTDPVQNLLNELDPEGAKAIIQIKPEIHPGFVQLKDQVDSLAKYAEIRVIKSEDDIKPATDDLVLIRKVAKAIDDLRRSYTDPLNEHVKTINTTFKKLTDPLNQADKTTLSKIKAYRDLVEKKRKEAEELNRLKDEIARREAELSGTGEITIDTTPVVVPQASKTIKTETGTLGGRKVRKARVIDFAKLDDMYKLPNEKLLDAAAKSGVKEIPGVEFYFEEVYTVRSK